VVFIARQPNRDNGSIYYNQARKNWTASYFIIDLETGQEKRVRKSFPTQELARQYLEEIMLQKNNKIFIENNGIPLIKLMKMLLNKKIDSNLITDRAYARTMDTIRIIEKCYLANKNINDISTEEIQAYLNSLTEIYSNSSIQKIYFQFKNAFEYSLNKGYIHENPMYETLKPKSKKEDKVLRALEVEEQKALTDYLLSTNLYETPYRNVFLIQLYMGLRVGEVLALKNSDFDLKRRILSVNKTLTTDRNDKVCVGKTTKTYAGKRELPIPDFILPYILEQMRVAQNNQNEMLFLTPQEGLVFHSTINRKLKSIAKKVGISQDISTHTLRHTYGTRCIESGMRAVALQRLMGHTDINVTLNTYTTVFNKYKEEELKKVNEYYMNNDILDNENLLDISNFIDTENIEDLEI
jgi:integrase